MVNKKTVIGMSLGLCLSQLIVYLTIDFYKFVARTALKLRPELIELTLWEALWSGHLTDWLWLFDPSTALLLNVFGFGVVGIWVGYMLGTLWEVVS